MRLLRLAGSEDVLEERKREKLGSGF